MKLTKLRRGLGVLMALGLALSPLSSARAAANIEGQSFVDSLKFGGDLRLRHDAEFNTGGKPDRNRERFRLRFGFEDTIQDVTAVLRFASGTGSQVSANQTEGGGFGQKGLWIDMAYLQYKAHEDVKLIGGRMPNPFWQLYASDSMWDPDLNPEGYAQKVELPMGDRLKVFGNFAQLPVNEIAATENDPWIIGEQVGGKMTLFEETKVTMAIADYGFINETRAPLGAVQQDIGNSLTGAAGTLTSPFNIVQFTGEIALHAGSIPLSLQGDYVTNTQENKGRGRNGYQTGFIAGKAAAAGTWEGAYFYKFLQDNATVANFADDDFGPGGTNRAGHIFWIAYSPRDYVQFKLKYYLTRVLDQTLAEANAASNAPFQGDLNRLFLDVLVKF